MDANDRTAAQDLVGTFIGKVETAKAEVAHLEHAIEHADKLSATAAAIRLRTAVEVAERAAIAAGVGQSQHHQYVAEALRDLQNTAYPLLERVPTQLTEVIATRRFLARFNVTQFDHLRTCDGIIDARGQTIANVSIEHVDLHGAWLAGATLHDIDGCRSVLDEVNAEDITLRRAQMIAASMRRADLRRCLAEHSDFSWANLERSNWRSASVFWCSFTGAVLNDVLCDDALFVECDLRGADLSVVNAGPRATSVGARFVRCDLRTTKWTGRDLGNVTFLDCRMHGVMGTVLATGVDIVRPDLSPNGDGGWIASAADVVNLWIKKE
jgi:uncharacterized protein YjbI with pentapeptide repeats